MAIWKRAERSERSSENLGSGRFRGFSTASLDAPHGESMSLEKELVEVRKDVVTDGYDMSIGEVVSLYKDRELIINPE